MEHPIDILSVLAHIAGFHGPILDKPKIKIYRHERSRVILPTMVGQSFAVDEILHLSIRDLCDQCMPTCFASAGAIKDVIFLPIRLGAESSPGSYKQRGSIAAPTAIGQILEIQFAVVGIHWRLQWANG